MAEDPRAEEEYSLFQENIISLLKDRTWFIDCIGYNFYWLANYWSCSVVLSERRLGEAHDFWLDDSGRTLREGIEDGTTELDHFKHVSFIAFWLRRMIPINETHRDPDPEVSREDQDFFLRYGNEICSLLIGFQICLFFDVAKVPPDGPVTSFKSREEYLRTVKFPQHLMRDFAMVLKHKNMSPHSLYLLYRSLFTTITPSHAPGP